MITFSYKNVLYTNMSRDSALELGVPSGVIDAAEQKATSEQMLLSRQIAYKTESDPRYMEWQFDQTLESEKTWRDKVTEIKLRYPLTTNS